MIFRHRTEPCEYASSSFTPRKLLGDGITGVSPQRFVELLHMFSSRDPQISVPRERTRHGTSCQRPVCSRVLVEHWSARPGMRRPSTPPRGLKVRQGSLTSDPCSPNVRKPSNTKSSAIRTPLNMGMPSRSGMPDAKPAKSSPRPVMCEWHFFPSASVEITERSALGLAWGSRLNGSVDTA